MSPISGNEFKWATDPFLADGKVKVEIGRASCRERV